MTPPTLLSVEWDAYSWAGDYAHTQGEKIYGGNFAARIRGRASAPAGRGHETRPGTAPAKRARAGCVRTGHAATGPGSHQSAAAGPGGPLLQLLPFGPAAPDPRAQDAQQRTRAHRAPGSERGSSPRILATWPAPDPPQAAARAAQLPGSEAGRSPGPGAAATGPGSHQGPGAGPSWAPAAAAPLRPGRAGSRPPGRVCSI